MVTTAHISNEFIKRGIHPAGHMSAMDIGNRLRGLGNAIVPQVAYEILRLSLNRRDQRHNNQTIRDRVADPIA